MHDRVLIKKIEPEKKTSSGFYIPTVDESVKARVIKVGSGKLTEDGVRIAPEVSVGDVVLFNVASAVSVTINREVFLVIKEEDILAIVGE